MLRRLIWSNLAAQSAEQVALAAVPIVAALWLGAGPAETGVLAAVQTLPFLLLSLPAGLLADRMARRPLMVAAEALRAASLFALPLLAWAGLLSIQALALLGFLSATGTVVYSVTAPRWCRPSYPARLWRRRTPSWSSRAAWRSQPGRRSRVRSWPGRAAPSPSWWPQCCPLRPCCSCPACRAVHRMPRVAAPCWRI